MIRISKPVSILFLMLVVALSMLCAVYLHARQEWDNSEGLVSQVDSLRDSKEQIVAIQESAGITMPPDSVVIFNDSPINDSLIYEIWVLVSDHGQSAFFAPEAVSFDTGILDPNSWGNAIYDSLALFRESINPPSLHDCVSHRRFTHYVDGYQYKINIIEARMGSFCRIEKIRNP